MRDTVRYQLKDEEEIRKARKKEKKSPREFSDFAEDIAIREGCPPADYSGNARLETIEGNTFLLWDTIPSS